MATEIQGSILMRTKITKEEWADIRKQAIDRELNVGEYVAQLLRAGQECIPPLATEKEEVA